MSERVSYIPRTRELYAPLPPYRWADLRGQPVPWQPLDQRLDRCRVLLGSSAGVYLEGQRPFGLKDDTSIRLVPSDARREDLRVSHFGYPVDYAQADPNCVFPIDRLRELEADGTIAGFAPSVVTFMGGIYSQRRVREELIPAVLDAVLAERIDLFYLVPA